MQKRKLGFSDLELTTVGFGTYALGGDNWEWAWGAQDDADSIAAMHRGLDLGINWIDTAPVYGLGHAEEVVGEAIRGHRDQVIVATKCGLDWNPGEKSVFGNLKADRIRQECEDSLRRLQTDMIDLLQIHWPDPAEDIEEAWGVVAELIKAGKVRYGGVSNFSVEQMKRVQPIHPIASLQPPYNMFNRDIEAEILPFCADNNIGVIAYGPMETGLLTGKFTPEKIAALPDNDWRKTRNDQYQEPRLSANLDFVEKLRPIAARSGHSLAQLAIAWVNRRPEMTASIVGARRPPQIEETAPASNWNLSASDIAEIDALLAERDSAIG